MVRSALALCLALKLPACVLVGGYGGPPPAARGPEAPPAAELRDFRGVIHCHSHLSHDSEGTEEEIARAANAVGLDFLVMTDHYTERGVLEAMRGFRGRTLFLPGAEIRAGKRYLLALGLERPIERSASLPEMSERIRAQGALAFAGHVEEYSEDELESFDFDGLEIFNVHAAAKETNPLSLILRTLFLPPTTFFRALAKPRRENLALWDRLLERRPVPVVAGNDAHDNVRLFGPLGGTVGSYEQMFRTVTTHVWARELDRDEILAALREGRCYVAFDAWRDATGFRILVEDGRCRVFVPESARIVLLQAGKPVAEAYGQWLESAIEKGKNYRVEVFLGGRRWILSSFSGTDFKSVPRTPI